MLAIVVPIYNESERSVATIKKILMRSKSLVIAVDDGSKDDSLLRLKKIFERERRVVILNHVLNLGKGAAMKTGAEAAWRMGARGVVFIDADGQHNPAHIIMFEEELKKYDLVFGFRDARKKMPWWRRWGNKMALGLVRLFFGVKRRDLLCGFLGMRYKAYKKVRWESCRYGVETEIAIRTVKKRLSFSEVKIDTIYLDKYKGVTIIDALKIFINLPWWYFSK